MRKILIYLGVCVPTEPNDNTKIGIVVTHPYSLLGGDLNNNVVVGIAKYFASFGFTTVRFNFRGKILLLVQDVPC
jgi:alpha/beta superfamily hydrolase